MYNVNIHGKLLKTANFPCLWYNIQSFPCTHATISMCRAPFFHEGLYTMYTVHVYLATYRDYTAILQHSKDMDGAQLATYSYLQAYQVNSYI